MTFFLQVIDQLVSLGEDDDVLVLQGHHELSGGLLDQALVRFVSTVFTRIYLLALLYGIIR